MSEKKPRLPVEAAMAREYQRSVAASRDAAPPQGERLEHVAGSAGCHEYAWDIPDHPDATAPRMCDCQPEPPVVPAHGGLRAEIEKALNGPWPGQRYSGARDYEHLLRRCLAALSALPVTHAELRAAGYQTCAEHPTGDHEYVCVTCLGYSVDELVAARVAALSAEKPDRRWSVTYGELPESVRALIGEGYEWDNKNISEQRDWAIAKLDAVLSAEPPQTEQDTQRRQALREELARTGRKLEAADRLLVEQTERLKALSAEYHEQERSYRKRSVTDNSPNAARAGVYSIVAADLDALIAELGETR